MKRVVLCGDLHTLYVLQNNRSPLSQSDASTRKNLWFLVVGRRSLTTSAILCIRHYPFLVFYRSMTRCGVIVSKSWLFHNPLLDARRHVKKDNSLLMEERLLSDS